jgi:3-oxoacyl-[acyl-carrier-protein] synthase-1/3-oxoacyl-[acyl-carrier-protein] synthase II
MGIISPVGRGIPQTIHAIRESLSGIQPLTLFPAASAEPLPVGEIKEAIDTGSVPRTHSLALIAARQALNDAPGDPPCAIVIGVTTGGVLTTEENLKRGRADPQSFAYHAVGSVADYLARELNCRGPVLTVSTACSSGGVALKVAANLLKTGSVKRVLAGGVDALCRLTYYGFNALQLIDPDGARPLDRDRKGMSVSEGAAMLVLEAHENPPANAVAQVLGAGLSCDAFHPAAPHPQGAGGIAAMQAAVAEAGIALADIDYINLHGTGTIHNDLSEASAIDTLFGDRKPLLSSVKGAFGHSLAAPGAIEAVVAALCIQHGRVPANTGCERPDPALKLDPVMKPARADLDVVLSNSFGFGGNNAAVILAKPASDRRPNDTAAPAFLNVVGSACITGSGRTEQTLEDLFQGKGCRGKPPAAEISKNLAPGTVRRLKRLPRMALALAVAAHGASGLPTSPAAVFFGTGWGPLSETYDFFDNMCQSTEELTSPTNFVGSVHNSPAGQVAIHFQSTGPNITATGGDYSFEQALITAGLLAGEIPDGEDMLVIGTDEYHEKLSPLFDRSLLPDDGPSDGGGALCLQKADSRSGLRIRPAFLARAEKHPEIISMLTEALGGADGFAEKYGVLLGGIPLAVRGQGEKQLDDLLAQTGFKGPVIDYRKFTGEYASASATATVLAIRLVQSADVPAQLGGKKSGSLKGKGALVIGLGRYVTAIEVLP